VGALAAIATIALASVSPRPRPLAGVKGGGVHPFSRFGDGDDWEADSLAVTHGSLKALRKLNRSFILLCNFFLFFGVLFVKGPV
jgi:hypothetical protein